MKLRISLLALAPLATAAMIATWQESGRTAAFDERLLLALHGLANPLLDNAMPWLTRLGSAVLVIPAAIAASAALMTRRRHADALFAVVGCVGAVALNRLLKATFQRPRPDVWDLHAPIGGWSFPSGHTMAATAAAAVLVALAWPTQWRWPALAAGLALAATVGLSRVYLGVHYPTDVAAGWLVAVAWVTLARWWIRPRLA